MDSRDGGATSSETPVYLLTRGADIAVGSPAQQGYGITRDLDGTVHVRWTGVRNSKNPYREFWGTILSYDTFDDWLPVNFMGTDSVVPDARVRLNFDTFAIDRLVGFDLHAKGTIYFFLFIDDLIAAPGDVLFTVAGAPTTASAIPFGIQ